MVQPSTRTRRRLALTLALPVYYLAVVLPHDMVQRALVRLFHRWTFWGYEWRFLLVWTTLFSAGAAWVALRLWRQRKMRLLGAWLGWVAVVTLVDRFALFSQSEQVHYPQYALLAVGLREVLGSAGRALVAATALGAADEGFQAAVLYAGDPSRPFDFKDVGLDILGAVGGLLVLAAMAVTGPGPAAPGGTGEPPRPARTGPPGHPPRPEQW